jgi:hypothetical protein
VCEAVTQGKKGLSNSISCLKQRGSSAPVRGGGKGQQQDAAHMRTRAQQLFQQQHHQQRALCVLYNQG